MSLQTAALTYAINHFDDIWAQFIKKLEADRNYIAASLKWESDKFTLIFGIDTDEVWEYHNRERLMLFSYNLDELPPADEALMYLKNQLKDLQQAEKEIAEGSKTVVVNYRHKGKTYTANTLLKAPWCPFYMQFSKDIPNIDNAIARMKYEHNIGPIIKTLDIVTKTDTTFDFSKYDFKFPENSHIINHHQNQWIEDQLTTIQFLENVADLKANYPYNINHEENPNDTTYDLYRSHGLAIIDAVVKSLTDASNFVEEHNVRAQMAYINDTFQNVKDANANALEPLREIFETLNTMIDNMTMGQLNNQKAIDNLAQDFIKNLTEKARESYNPFD